MRFKLGYSLLVLGGAGYFTLIYISKVITEGGIYADETQTSGAIPAWQIIVFLASSLCLLIGVYAFYANFVMNVSNRASGTLKSSALWALVFSGLSLFVYWFAPLGIGLGMLAIVLAIKSHTQDSLAYGVVGAFALLGAATQLVILFK